MTTEPMAGGARIRITGIVQGVGFRPFVYNLAARLNVRGFCLNDSEGVVIEAAGERLDEFINAIKASPPPLSRIEGFKVEPLPGGGSYAGFSIRESVPKEGKSVLISPDIATCGDCLRELFDPSDRRYLYPFINCTNCGPRYSIIKDIPYDRPMTTMAPFRMCADCEKEYRDPANRRFHAQPNACVRCGPRAWLEENGKGRAEGFNLTAINAAKRLLKDGAILAVKGIGGFHLACDAENDTAVKRLRMKKRRGKNAASGAFSNKPFAVMASDVASARSFAEISHAEVLELDYRTRPIVLLKKGRPEALAPSVAPNNNHYGVMLPYAPLHHMLLSPSDERLRALVMTSGNVSEEPIVVSNGEALKKLSGIADYFLLHDRDIYMRVDDSIVRATGARPSVLRRARGFIPLPIDLGEETAEVLSCGAELKSTFCITKGRHALLSQHIGDLENQDTLDYYKESLDNLKRSFRASPSIIACDMHPDYLSTRFASEYAAKNGIPDKHIYTVQHHHAHIASVMAEHVLRRPVIGVAFDGTGYGTDGNIWGGEFFIADRRSFRRKGRLRCVAMPGGEQSIKEPWRMAVSHLMSAFGGTADLKEFYSRFDPRTTGIIMDMASKGFNSPLTSSMGRLFDAVSSIIGLRDFITFEAEAAIELEQIAEDAAHDGRGYAFGITGDRSFEIDAAPVIRDIAVDLKNGVDAPVISRRFHQAVANAIRDAALRLRAEHMINDVALSGGVFQNRLLAETASMLLSEAGFTVWRNERVPTNDGGVSLGQAAVAWELHKNRGVRG